MTADAKYTAGNLAYAEAASPQWPVSVRLTVSLERSALLEALEDYEAIERGDLPGDLGEASEVISERTAALAAKFRPCAVAAGMEATA